MSTKGKTIQTKQDIPKQKKTILSTIVRAWHKTYQQPDVRETEQIWQPKKHNEKAEWINDMTREQEGLEEGPKAEIHIYLLKKTLKNISNWKTSGHDGIQRFWFKKFTSIHDRLVQEMNRCLQDAQVPDWMIKGKAILIQNDPSKGTAPNNCVLVSEHK